MPIPQELAIQIKTGEDKVIRLYPGSPLQDFYGEELTQIQIAQLAVALLRICSLADNLLLPFDGIRNPISDIPIPESRSGIVYFALRSDGLVKIGFTTHPKQRYEQLTNQHGEELNILHEIKSDNPFELEQQIHEELNDYRIQHEWFNLPQEVLEGIIQR